MWLSSKFSGLRLGSSFRTAPELGSEPNNLYHIHGAIHEKLPQESLQVP